jgi:hypothetical protein
MLSSSSAQLLVLKGGKPGDGASPLGLLGILGAVGAALILVLVFWASGSRPSPKGSASEDRSLSARVEPSPAPAPDARALTPPLAPPRLESPPKPPPPTDSLASARDYARSNPGDFAGRVNLYERALEDLKGTPKSEEVLRELEALKKSAGDQVTSELAALDAEMRPTLDSEEFGRALATLARSRNRQSHPAWPRGIDDRSSQIRQKAQSLFSPLKDRAMEAKRKGELEEVRTAQERVARWGLDAYSDELAKAISEATPPPSPEAAAYLTCWEAAAGRAEGRDYAGAGDQIKRGSSALKNPDVRKEASEDQEILLQAALLLKEALLLLPKWQKGQSLSLEIDGPSGAPERIDGTVVRLDPYRVELKKGDSGSPQVVPFGELRASTLARLLKASRNNLSAQELRALAAACLLEGGPDPARALLEGTPAKPPEKYWARARSLVEAAVRGGATRSPREGEARSLYYSAETAFEDVESTADAAQTHAALLKDYADTGFVSRNRAFISLRSQGGKEYLFFPEDLTARGGFLLLKNPKTESCLTGESDLDAARVSERFVEFRFSVLPATDYRLWVYAGACCAETFACSYQSTDLTAPPSRDSKEAVPAEPGTTTSLPVKLPFLSLKKTHAAHSGPKAPARWEWIPVVLPKFLSGGRKQVRLFSNQKGFSIAYVCVSAQRTSPPSEGEVKAAEKIRMETPGIPPLVRLAGRSAPRALIADFETDPQGWAFIGGQEFAGAKGALTLDPGQAHGGQRSYRLDADFKEGGVYVGTWCEFNFMKEKDFKELRMWVKTSTVKTLSIRLGDGTGQCHQRSGVALQATKDWQELVLKISDLVGQEHWGGANDGRWHGPAAGFGINLSTGSFIESGSKTGSIWIDDVQGVLGEKQWDGGPIQDPSFENQTVGDGTPLTAPWSMVGPAQAGCDGRNGRGGSKCGYIYDGTGSGARSDIVQTVRVTPNTNYRLSCWIQTGESFPAQGSVGVRTTGGALLSHQPFALATNYTPLAVTFNSGPHSSLVIFAGFTSVAGQQGAWIHVDDWNLSNAGRK